MLIGMNVGVPEGKDVGGDFKTMPLCRSADQYGCVVSFVTFRSDSPPPAAMISEPIQIRSTRGLS